MPILGRRDAHAELDRRLARLGRVFPLHDIAGEALGGAEVVSYYEHCFDAYRRHHSPEGALHMALNEGRRFDAAGFYGQVDRMQAVWARAPVRDALELGFGHGFNLLAMAQRRPDVQFTGLDLTPQHVAHVQAAIAERALANVAIVRGDFQALPFAGARFDQLWAYEALCYAPDTPRALREAYRVLRPGGAFTIFDGYLPRPLQTMAPAEALAIRLVAKGMALDRFQPQDEFTAQAREAGFEVEAVAPLEAQIMPNLRRLERVTGAVVRWPWLGRRALARRHPMRGRNVLSGYLMPQVVSMGLLFYRQIVLRKPADNPT